MSSKDWWTNERRQAQRERINKIKPWLKSTGAITAEGKAVISMNAFKGKSRNETLKALGEDKQPIQNSHRGES
ncbi:MAG: hypothetical protein WA154_11695 [Moraxellaceae bacterium]